MAECPVCAGEIKLADDAMVGELDALRGNKGTHIGAGPTDSQDKKR